MDSNKILYQNESYKIIGCMKIQSELRSVFLKATNLELGMLINFGSSSLTYKRILNKITKH
jgi:hypothetical protein